MNLKRSIGNALSNMLGDTREPQVTAFQVLIRQKSAPKFIGPEAKFSDYFRYIQSDDPNLSHVKRAVALLSMANECEKVRLVQVNAFRLDYVNTAGELPQRYKWPLVAVTLMSDEELDEYMKKVIELIESGKAPEDIVPDNANSQTPFCTWWDLDNRVFLTYNNTIANRIKNLLDNTYAHNKVNSSL